MYVIERCYNGCGWAAYAYPNSWMSVYQMEYYKHAAVQLHELGHNFGFVSCVKISESFVCLISCNISNAAKLLSSWISLLIPQAHSGGLNGATYSDHTGLMVSCNPHP